MTPRQARVALGGFAVLSVGVAFNALYLQGGDAAGRRAVVDQASGEKAGPRRPGSPAASPAADHAKRTAALEPGSIATDAASHAPPDQAGPDTIRAIQRELAQRGYGPLASDGVMRMATRAAIMDFEHASRLPLTGEASEALLKHILLGAPSASPSAGAGARLGPQAEAVVKQVQRMLARRGYRPGPADGRLSAETLAAIRAFETDQGLAPKGRISAEVVSRLQQAAARPAHAGR
jgi:peptidoglycan hydrolase-like protein with peptidoglycan-binding domain